MKSTRLIHNLPLWFVLLLAFGLRVAGLADHNIWWDEGIGVWLARMPVLESVRWTAGDVHPPLYYGLLRGWYLLVGDGEFVLRFLSVLCSFLTIPLIYRLGKTLAPRRAISSRSFVFSPSFLAASSRSPVCYRLGARSACMRCPR